MVDSRIKRVYIEKRAGFDGEAGRLRADLAAFLGASWPALAALAELRILNRYDVSGLDEDAFLKVTRQVLSEPQCDLVYDEQGFTTGPEDKVFAVEYLPGQYDQRSDSAEQCAELVAGKRPRVRNARVYVLRGTGELPKPALDAVKSYLINPVDSREASLEKPSSLDEEESPVPAVPVLTGFILAAEPSLRELASRYGLAMSGPDLAFCGEFFRRLKRDPTLAELRVLDTYWSDHCRHTTFTTVLDEIYIEEGPLAAELREALRQYEEARKEVYPGATDRPRTLMDLATIGGKLLKKRGLLADLDESREINACSLKINAEFEDGSQEPWLLLFKNETHKHPTEIEPFGGAATCLGGAIRDPLSGRAYVYGAMRVSGGGDPRAALAHTLPGKLPQIKIAREAAAGYASYGNQIGIATGQVAEFYHSGFTAKRMELGAVMGASPAGTVRRESPRRGDLVLLIGGKTGRDGIGGATGSSKAHTGESVETAGAEVQKGNAVEERKLQRLFRNPEASLLIKRCNDFGAGGVSVAVGELAPGLDIDLDAVPKKYAGLDGIELAISESQERMAVVCSPVDAEKLIARAAQENLEAVVIARVSFGEDEEEPPLGALYARGEETPPGPARLRMRWRGETIVDLPRSFLDSHGAPRRAGALIRAADQGDLPGADRETVPRGNAPNASLLLDDLERELRSLRSGSRRGLQERFDGSIGASSVLFPWGGASQGTPECGLAMLLPSLDKTPLTAGVMSFGYDPEAASRCPYTGAKGAVKEALVKFACLGGDPFSARLSLQEYFERANSPASWGRPLSALLGALEAQLALGVPAIGGKDSMSGSYRDEGRGIELAVPPTLVAFAAGAAPAKRIRSGALSGSEGSILLAFNAAPLNKKNEWDVFRANLKALAALSSRSLVKAAFPVPAGGALVSLALMAFGSMTGVEAEGDVLKAITAQGSFLVEVDGGIFGKNIEEFKTSLPGARWSIAGRTLASPVFKIITGSEDTLAEEETPEQRTAWIELEKLRLAYEYPLSRIYPQTASGEDAPLPAFVRASEKRPRNTRARAGRSAVPPLVVLPVFPGTNCEWDMERAFVQAGARVRQVVFRNLSSEAVRESSAVLARAIEEAQIVALSGGFSAGDEPDGSGKFIANVFRSSPAADALSALLEKRDGLVLGICNGFQALIKLGLVPGGRIREADETMPALTYNNIGRHVSRMVRTTVMSVSSPWLALEESGTVHILPVSHGEGRVVIREEEARRLFDGGQIAFCYAGPGGKPAVQEPHNPNGSSYAIEGMTSPDGRVLGKMGHSERRGNMVHINIPGNKYQRIFEAGVAYFT
ncbi:MAG: phosphoribosylformylglycinamidine synthase [Spirochaetaceae bacterium]|jgi:phosphoribosylformylglycinamidine synthase|nr:phosphoribosylformylglycinamidine synthase [Spirochaetaceae bacterium]